MSEVARSEGWNVDSVDYRGLAEPRDRITRLLSFCRDIRGDLVLVGSSLGGYVATCASALLHARGLFLMAPAFYLPDRELTTRSPHRAQTIVHGWHDEVVPVTTCASRGNTATLHILDTDHGLHSELKAAQLPVRVFPDARWPPKRQ
jgi:predicted esterase